MLMEKETVGGQELTDVIRKVETKPRLASAATGAGGDPSFQPIAGVKRAG